MRSLLNFKVWLLFSLVWVGAMAYWCFVYWPKLPLDVSAIDPETLKILEGAKWRHLSSHVVAALVPPAIAYVIGRLLCRWTAGDSEVNS